MIGPGAQFGRYFVRTLLDSRFALDGGSMFGVVPRTLWAKVAVPDERNRIPLVSRLLYIEGEGRRILVDTGLGDKWDDKRRDIFAVDAVDGGAVAQLADIGVAPEDITDVVFTHLHFDHAAGTTYRGADDEPVLRFPAAVHHVQARHWEWAFHPTMKDAGSFRAEDFAALSGTENLHLLEGDSELFPDLRVFALHGHTCAMQGVRIGPSGADVLYTADLVPTAAHLRWPYIMGFDNEPLTTLAEKQRWLLRAASEGTVLVFEHDPEIAAVRLEADDRGVHIAEQVEL